MVYKAQGAATATAQVVMVLNVIRRALNVTIEQSPQPTILDGDSMSNCIGRIYTSTLRVHECHKVMVGVVEE